MYRFLKDNILIIIVVLLVFIIGVIIFKNKKTYFIFKDENITFKYNYTWDIIDYKNIKLKHNSGSNISIKINVVDDSSLDSLVDSLLLKINLDSKYKMINKEKIVINNRDVYSVLYKRDNNNTLVNIMKIGDRLIIYKYNASDRYFDILLDNSNEIYNSIKLNNKKEINFYGKKEIKFKKIEFNKNKIVDLKLNSNSKYKINSYNYEVNYSIPDIFRNNNISSNKGNYLYRDGNNSINLNTFVLNKNIFDYLDDFNNKESINYKYKYLDDKFYENKKYFLEKRDSYYIYKNSYNINNNYYEHIELIYVLDKNHLFNIIISGKNNFISEKLINNIRVNSYKKYYYNVNRVIKNNNLILSLLSGKINISIDSNYREIDYNVDKERVIYLEKKDRKVKYSIISNINSALKISDININSNKDFGDYKNLYNVNNLNYNNREFIHYKGYYNTLINKKEKSVYMNVLFLNIGNEYLMVEIKDYNENEFNITECLNIFVK